MHSGKTTVFSATRCANILPGMVESIKHLIECATSDQARNFRWGIITSAIVLSTHTAELLLKYKLEQEGKSFGATHDLYDLYQKLKQESKVKIQEEFDKLVSESTVPPNGLPNGWDSAEAVFKSARRAHVEWRYLVETKLKTPRQSPDIEPSVLYTAVLSVFRTIPLRHSINTFQIMRVEDIPDPDVRERALNYYEPK